MGVAAEAERKGLFMCDVCERKENKTTIQNACSQKEQNHDHATLKRKSNLELLRIVAMITIVAHHYVVNSGITNEFDYSSITLNMVFLQLWGMWGKTAINVFVMITGYFMCSRQLTVRRIAKI